MIYLFSLLLVILDQVSKYFIEANFNLGQSFTVIDKFFYITHVTNKGAAWGMLENMNIIFIPVTIIVLGMLIFFKKRMNHRLYDISSALICGGAIGNFIDRIFRPDGVVDFLEFHFGSYIFPVFNFADICVVVGGCLMVIFVIFLYKEEKEEADGTEEDNG